MSFLVSNLFKTRHTDLNKLFTPINIPNVKTSSIMHRGKNYVPINPDNFKYIHEFLSEIYTDKLCYVKKNSIDCLVYNGFEKYNNIIIPKSSITAVQNCKKRFIFFYIKIDIFEPESIESGIDSNHIGGHINVLIFDTHKKEVERYEPHGYETIVNLTNIDDLLLNKLKTELGYKYFKPVDFCPYFSLQYLHSNTSNKKYEDKGYCTVWSTWYMECRLLNPDEDRNILVNRLSSYFMYQEEKDKFLHTTIYNYWTMLRKYIEFRKIHNLSPHDAMDKLMEIKLYNKESIKYKPKLPQIKIYN